VKPSRKLLIGVAAVAFVVGGCSAASHISAIQPPKLPHETHAPLIANAYCIKKPRFQMGAGIDLYGYRHEDYTIAADAEVSYLQNLHANSVVISFPFFMHGGQARGVYAKANKTPTPAELGTLIRVAETDKLYVSLRPLLANASLGVPRNQWKPSHIRAWFASYQRFLLPYAKMARKNCVPNMYVGAEFQDFATSPLWNRLDRALHHVFKKGTLAYANNGREFYPDMGGRRAQISADSYPDFKYTSPQASVGTLTSIW
jgi:hypothetical protein